MCTFCAENVDTYTHVSIYKHIFIYRYSIIDFVYVKNAFAQGCFFFFCNNSNALILRGYKYAYILIKQHVHQYIYIYVYIYI